jgi:hypothetical protein
MLHCSLLKAIRPKRSTGIPPFLLFRGLCLVSPSSLWLGLHGVYSSTSPSLRLFVLSNSLIGCQSVQVYYHQPFFPHIRMQTIKILLSVGGCKVPRVAGAPAYLALSLCAASSFVSEGANPSTMSSHSFFKSWQMTWLFNSWSPAQWFPWWCLFLIPLLHSGSWMSILLRLPLQHCPWSTFSVISGWLSVLYDCVLYDVPLLHGRSSICGRWPTARCWSPCRFFSARQFPLRPVP